MTPALCHGTLVVLGNKGVLITGSSGSGKSTLALKLIVTGMGTGYGGHFRAVQGFRYYG